MSDASDPSPSPPAAKSTGPLVEPPIAAEAAPEASLSSHSAHPAGSRLLPAACRDGDFPGRGGGRGRARPRDHQLLHGPHLHRRVSARVCGLSMRRSSGARRIRSRPIARRGRAAGRRPGTIAAAILRRALRAHLSMGWRGAAMAQRAGTWRWSWVGYGSRWARASSWGSSRGRNATASISTCWCAAAFIASSAIRCMRECMSRWSPGRSHMAHRSRRCSRSPSLES